jgi:hypothetical protein
MQSHLDMMSTITTRAPSQFPWLDSHQQDTQHYGLRAKNAEKKIYFCTFESFAPFRG